MARELDKQFENVHVLEQCAIFDPQLFPTDMDLVMDYESTPIVELDKYFGKRYDDVPLCIDLESLSREWYHAKVVMYDVRRQPPISNKIASLDVAKAVAAKASAGADDEEGKESEVDPATGRALKKGERQRMALSETFVKLFAEFWGIVQNSTEGSHFPSLHKIVKIYIVQPHSSIECERGFSAQNKTKTPARNGLSMARLELLMRISWSRRKDGVDLRKSDEIL